MHVSAKHDGDPIPRDGEWITEAPDLTSKDIAQALQPFHPQATTTRNVTQAYRFALDPTPAQQGGRTPASSAGRRARGSGALVTADRWFPSSKTCSACGAVKARLALAEREFRCEHCGHEEDRDVNAARNLLHLAASGADRLNARGGAVRPRAVRQAPVKQEPGTRQRDQPGTAARQRTAVA